MDKIVTSRVTSLYRLALQVPNLEEVKAFYANVWKLRPTSAGAGVASFRSAAVDHDDLFLSEGERSVDHIAFEVASHADLATLTDRLERAGFPSLPKPSRLLDDGHATASFTDPDGRKVELVVADGDHCPLEVSDDPLAPLRIGHVVFWTKDQQETENFYRLLGFQITDRTHIGMSFLRCNADHHTLALVKSESGKTGLQHIAFDVRSIDNVMKNFSRLRALDVECVWGVGRHGPGNNVFSYYSDPAGNFIEYYGEMDLYSFDDVEEPRIWGPEHKGDVWGVAGIPPQAFRE
ncbi:VOC family protein [Sphingobium sp. H39-3-25]|uniref:VOC family protein n=1 Tax=Sphingobium arseniciresistens TaxID=3030834 RepID=UPI0023BA1D9B|nr:VOC family protein [Sphingobium arseniciresistens]